MRRLIAFPCEGDTLVATLDEGVARTGLLIVSGGSEIRAGTHRGMAQLAVRLAAAGTSVFRFDRRGVGDSAGVDGGYASSAADIAAALAAFRAEQPHLSRVVGFGNCDAATALALFGRDAGLDAVILANPWVVDAGDLPPAAAIRRRYAGRLADPRSWVRLATGRISLSKLWKGLWHIFRREPQELADDVIAAIAGWGDDARIVLADGDATAIAFAEAAAARNLATATNHIATASHSFADTGEALEAAITRGLQP